MLKVSQPLSVTNHPLHGLFFLILEGLKQAEAGLITTVFQQVGEIIDQVGFVIDRSTEQLIQIIPRRLRDQTPRWSFCSTAPGP